MEPVPESLPAMLRGRRGELGLTQAELARRAGVSVRAVRYLEQGRVRNPRQASIRQLIAALETPAELPAVDPTVDMALSIGVLGPLTVECGGKPVDLGHTRQACLLGLLALHPNLPVPLADIVDVLWGGRPPRSHADLVNGSVRRLRKQLGPALRLTATGRGYRLEVRPEELDLLRFEELTTRARAAFDAGELQTAHETYELGLACWRGPVLAGLDPVDGHPAAGPLSRQRLSATLAYADVSIDLGRHEQAAAWLGAVRDDEPLHEGLHARLMVALAGCGRQAAALELFDELRTRLSTELGIEPGPEIRAAQLKVLRQEIPASASGLFRGRNYLPRDVDDFVGRVVELDRLTGVPSPPPVTAINGMAGVGKTALAIHLGHRLADRYPDGQLFVDLHAHSSTQGPLSPHEALDALLRQLGVDGRRIPDQVDQCAAMWRSLLVGRDILVLLDDAASAAQVRPLLPGGGTNCLVLITSRNRLTSVEGLRPLSLEVLPAAEAGVLFTRVAGADRAVGRQDEVNDISRLCGFLPLAIRIAAARLRDRPSWTVEHLVSLLQTEHRRLPELSADDRSVSAAFALSHRHLNQAQQRMFRLLGEFPGVGIGPHVAAALADIGLDEAERLLEQLVDVHLLYQPAIGQYRFHDLIREHARETGRIDPAQTREAAMTRLLDYYLHVANQAADLLEPTRRRFPPAGPRPEHLPRLTDATQALAWFETERANLADVAAAAAERGRPDHCWQLTQTLWRFFFLRGHIHDWIGTHLLALAITRRIGDTVAQAEIRKNLGLGYWRCGNFTEALKHHQRALTLDRRNGDPRDEAKTHNHLGLIHGRAGRHEQALVHQRRSAELYRAVGDCCGETRALLGIGDIHHHAGRPAESTAHFRRALDIARTTGDKWSEAMALIGLGFTLQETESPEVACDYLEQALKLTRTSGDRWGEGMVLTGSALAHHRMGAFDEAISQYQQAIILAQEIGDRWWERIATTGLGRVCASLGRTTEAVGYHERALELTRLLGDGSAEAGQPLKPHPSPAGSPRDVNSPATAW